MSYSLSKSFLLEKEKKENWTQKYQIAECQLFTEVFRPVLELYNLQACKRKQALTIFSDHFKQYAFFSRSH